VMAIFTRYDRKRGAPRRSAKGRSGRARKMPTSCRIAAVSWATRSAVVWKRRKASERRSMRRFANAVIILRTSVFPARFELLERESWEVAIDLVGADENEDRFGA